jgi:hypothetical protein
MHHAGPGWQFLTGKPADVELLRSKLGFVDLNPQVDQNDPASHSGMVRFGNEPQAWWAACQGRKPWPGGEGRERRNNWVRRRAPKSFRQALRTLG